MAKLGIYNRNELIKIFGLSDYKLRQLEKSMDFPEVIPFGSQGVYNNETVEFLKEKGLEVKNNTLLKE